MIGLMTLSTLPTLTARGRFLAARANGSGRSLSHCAQVAVRRALELGTIVHAAHPDFGGVVTVGPYHPAVADRSAAHRGFAILHHGGTTDVTFEGDDIHGATRYFISQVGKRNAFNGAIAALRKARNGGAS
jgi:hypothetical protein